MDYELIQEWQIKSKTVMSWSSRKKKEGIFLYHLFSPEEFFLTFVFYLNLQCINKYFYISKNITSYKFLFVFKIVESLLCIL